MFPHLNFNFLRMSIYIFYLLILLSSSYFRLESFCRNTGYTFFKADLSIDFFSEWYLALYIHKESYFD
jgi:hypothetical protein